MEDSFMSKSQTSGTWIVVVIGVVLVGWYFKSSETSAPPPTPGLIQRIDWGDLANQFRIHNPRLVMKLDRKISAKKFPVVEFEVEAIEQSQAVVFEATFVDANGVKLGRIPIFFEPDYLTEGAGGPVEQLGMWPAG